jgi:hypothetical protein
MGTEAGERRALLGEILVILDDLPVVLQGVGPVVLEVGHPLPPSGRGEDGAVPSADGLDRRAHDQGVTAGCSRE